MLYRVITARYQNFRRQMLSARRRELFIASILICLLCLCACTSSPTSGKAVSLHPTSTPASPAKGTVLFQSDWSQQHSSWKIAAGWQQTDDYLQSDVNTQLLLTIPYTPPTSNYVVEFHLQIVDVPKSGGYFQFAASKNAHEDGYRAYVSPLLIAGDHLMWVHPAAAVLINPLDNTDGAEDIHDYDPTSRWRTYQVAVTGPYVTFSVENHRLSYALSSHTQTLSRGPLQFTCTGAILRLGQVRVLAG
jgi:hypothetical protein